MPTKQHDILTADRDFGRIFMGQDIEDAALQYAAAEMKCI